MSGVEDRANAGFVEPAEGEGHSRTALVTVEHDRQKFLGGSDVAAIFGVSPWKTTYQLWLDKTQPRSPTPDQNEARQKFFRRRKRQEPVVAEMLKEDYGIDVTRLSMDDNPNRYRDPVYPFMAAEVDFEFRMNEAIRRCFPARPEFAAIPDGTLCNGEIKTVHPFMAHEWGEQGTEDVPVHYEAQVVHGLGVAPGDRPAAIVAALIGIDILLAFPVMRNDVLIKAMREKAAHFWNFHVMGNVPPDPVNIDDVVRMYKHFNGKPVDLSPEAYDALQKLELIRSQAKQCELDQAEAEWRIARCVSVQWGVMLPMQAKPEERPDLPTVTENALLLMDGREVGSWNRQRGASLDQKRLKIEQPDIVRDFTRSYAYRVFRQIKPRGKKKS